MSPFPTNLSDRTEMSKAEAHWRSAPVLHANTLQHYCSFLRCQAAEDTVDNRPHSRKVRGRLHAHGGCGEVSTHHRDDAGQHWVVKCLQLQTLQDKIVAAILQQLFSQMLRRVQVFAGRVLSLTLALQTNTTLSKAHPSMLKT